MPIAGQARGPKEGFPPDLAGPEIVDPMSSNATCSDLFTLRGDLGAPTFLPWIARHARRLGLSERVTTVSAAEVCLVVEGPPDLLDAMELGVSLGPIDVWVETIERERLGSTS